ncbi:MAG TPA: nuclear transport factor 2 family protein [Gemmatimonadales bacterium]|nr:nuclear transport factor 2 family protein [Gemmatimonadales bacterium]
MTNRTCAAGLLLLLASVVPSVARAQIPDSTIPLQTVISETNRFRAEYADYFNKKDIAGLMTMYASNAIFTAEDGTRYTGQAEIKAYFTSMAATMPHIVITSESLLSYGATAIDMGTLTMHPPGGGEVKSRYLAVLRRERGGAGNWDLVRVSRTPVTK